MSWTGLQVPRTPPLDAFASTRDRDAMASAPILTLKDISLTFGGNPLLESLDLSIHENERICLVGRNGSGKSTLLKIIAGLVEPDSGERFLQPGYAVAYMEQDPDFDGYATLGDYAAADLDPGEHYRLEMVMEGVKLNPDQPPDQASGGERRRAALAKLLASDAELLLLDEPTNHLDIEVIAWLESYLKQTRKSFVLISHDRAFLRNLTRSILWVDRGEVRRLDKGFEAFEDWRDKVFEEEDTARHKLNRLIKSEARWAVEGISARRKRNMGRVRRLGQLRQDRSDQITRAGAAKMAFEDGPKSGRMVLEANAISKSFDDQVIVKDFSLRVMRGDRVAFVGPNGVGKTTLLNMLIGKETPDSGTVKLGTNLIPVVFDQNRDALNTDASLWESLTGDKELGVSGRNDQILVRGTPKHVVGYLKEFLFTENQARGPVSALSGGEKARLLLAKLMARENNLLIMDEPTNDLDVETLDLLQELIDDYQGTVLLVSHDRDFLDRVATTTIAMEGQGRVTAYAGGWSDYQAQKPVHQETVSKSKPAPVKKPQTDSAKSKSGLTYVQQHRLQVLPDEIARLEAEIAKLETFLSDAELYQKEPAKFSKATEALTDRQTALATAEEEWLTLLELEENG